MTIHSFISLSAQGSSKGSCCWCIKSDDSNWWRGLLCKILEIPNETVVGYSFIAGTSIHDKAPPRQVTAVHIVHWSLSSAFELIITRCFQSRPPLKRHSEARIWLVNASSRLKCTKVTTHHISHIPNWPRIMVTRHKIVDALHSPCITFPTRHIPHAW